MLTKVSERRQARAAAVFCAAAAVRGCSCTGCAREHLYKKGVQKRSRPARMTASCDMDALLNFLRNQMGL